MTHRYEGYQRPPADRGQDPRVAGAASYDGPVNETIDTELWSTYDLRLDQPLPEHPMQWFQYGLSQRVSGGWGRVATQADTNLVRPGNAGLQHGCSMGVRAWRARAVAPRLLLRSDEWWAWCATLRVDYLISTATVATWTLDELLRAPRLRAESPGSFIPPLRLPSQINYEVRITPTALAAHHDAVRQIAITARPEYTYLPPVAWEPIKLRCYLRGNLTRSIV